MEYSVLEKVGLTEGEAKVYLALIHIGKSTIGAIIRESKVSSSKVYEILERLQNKGLVSVIIENNKKCFEPKDPSRFSEIISNEERDLEQKKREVNRLIPALKGIYENSSTKEGAEILQGFKGLMTWHDEILDECKKGDTILIISPTQANEQMNAHLLEWHSKRIKRGIKCKLLYNNHLNEWAKERKNLELLEYRFLPKNITSPVGLNITEKSVANTVFGDNILTFVIKNKEVAQNYKVYFDLLWEQSKK